MKAAFPGRSASCRATGSPRRRSSPWPASDDTDEELAKTEGSAMPGVELRTRHRSTASRPAPGEEGEVRAKAPQLMKGYLDASLDAEAFDEDGWFRTGDLGVLDERRHADHHRPAQGRHHPQGRERLGQGGRGPPLPAPQGGRRGRHRPARRRAAARRSCAVVPPPRVPSRSAFDEMVEFLKGEGLMVQKLPEQPRDRRRHPPQPRRQDPQARPAQALRRP